MSVCKTCNTPLVNIDSHLFCEQCDLWYFKGRDKGLPRNKHINFPLFTCPNKNQHPPPKKTDFIALMTTPPYRVQIKTHHGNRTQVCGCGEVIIYNGLPKFTSTNMK